MKIQDFPTYLKQSNKTDIIFDFDETLATLKIDWDEWANLYIDLLRKFEPDFEENVDASVINLFTKKYGKDFRDEAIEVNYEGESENYHGYSKDPVALELLQKVAKDFNVHLWTSNDRQTVTPILQELDIENLFTRKVFNNDVIYIKPDADGFTLINKNILPVSRFLFIGDSMADETASKNAGIDFINIDEFE